MTLRGIDISNLQGHPDSYRNQPWYQQAEFVIVQAIEPPAGFNGHDFVDPVTNRRGYTRIQLQAALDDGKKVGIYTWLWDAYSGQTLVADQVSRLALIPDDMPIHFRPWLDVEDTTPSSVADRRDDVLVALGVLDQWAVGRGLPPAGVYTGQWYIDGGNYLAGWFPDGRAEWLADYSQPAGSVLNDQGRVGHQFTSTPVDSDVFLDSELGDDMAAIDYVPQEYRDKFGAKTPADVYANLEGIITSLQSNPDAQKLAQIKAIVES